MKVFDDEKDKLLDHEYDGIGELNNHMPVWWLWLFFFTIAWGAGYIVWYQLMDIAPDQIEQYENQVAEANAKYGLDEQGGGDQSFVYTISDDPEAIARGQEIYMSTNNLCFTCHGNAGEGLVGPNLTDNQWIHGCKTGEVAVSIIEGFPLKGMIAYGSGAALTNEQVNDVVSYIASIQGTEPANAKPVDTERATECVISDE